MPVKSLITSPSGGFTSPVGKPLMMRGFAWSGRTAVKSVSVSADDGRTWQPAHLHPLIEHFAWRRFEATLTAIAKGPAVLMAQRLTRLAEHSLSGSAPWNPGGYCNNAVHRISGYIQ
jgi:sulfite oxidase